jgi:uncharacterized membrane protein YfcA
MLDIVHMGLAMVSGAMVGLTLGLVGGGGSILAVPLMLYVVGVSNPHVAIGTSALSVSANAVVALGHHTRAHTVNWRCGTVFAGGGLAGAFAGATIGKAVDGQRLLILFAIVMIAVAGMMLRQRRQLALPKAHCDRHKSAKVASYGLASGMFSGFFGIGGGFLIVPSLITAANMATIEAVGTSLVAVSAFGLATATSYALAGLVNWGLAGLFVLGGLAGTRFGVGLAQRLANTGTLSSVFAALIAIIAIYMLLKSAGAV